MKICDECYLVDTDACPQGGRANDNKMCEDLLKYILPVPCKIDASLIVELSISVLWCDNYGGGTAWLKVIDGKTEIELMEVEA